MLTSAFSFTRLRAQFIKEVLSVLRDPRSRMVVFVPPNFLVVWAAQRIDSARVGILLMTEVLAGSITAALWAGEPFGWREAIGSVLVVSAALTEVFGNRSRPG